MAVKQVDEFENVTSHLDTVNTEFTIGKLEPSFTDATDAEAIVEEYFKRIDYETFNLRGLSSAKRSWLSNWFDFFDGFNFSKAGVPDLFVCRVFYQVTPYSTQRTNFLTESAKVQDYRFVEVKSSNDDLRQSQLRWLGEHPHLPTEVIVVMTDD